MARSGPARRSEGNSAPQNDLEERVLRVLPDLTPKQQRLARLLIQDQLAIAFASAEEVGVRAGVDAATVVRFSRLLGYRGYADLRESVRRSVPQFLTAIERVSGRLSDTSVTGDLTGELFAQDMRNLEETARLNTAETIAHAVDALLSARCIFCIGHGISAFAADHLAHQLALIGLRSQRLSRSVVEGAIELASSEPQDVVVAVSVWRYLKDTLRLFESAQEAGAIGIALTDSRASPLALAAKTALIAPTQTVELGHSIGALITLTNILASQVAAARSEQAISRLKKIDAFYERFDVMAE